MENVKIKKLRENQAEELSNLLEMDGYHIGKTAKDVMIKPVLLKTDDSAKKIMRKLKREDTEVCIVVTNDKKFVGEIDVKVLINLFLEQLNDSITQKLGVAYTRKFLYKSAKELVNEHRSTVKFSDSLKDVIELIHKEGFSYIPVLNEKEKVVGVVTPSSVIKFLQRS